MANIIDVTATTRTAIGGGIRALRRTGQTPAVVYGKGVENQNIQLDTLVFTKLLKRSASDNILVNLQVGPTRQLALVQDVQHDYLKDIILHVDFHAIKEDEEIHAAIPVETTGVPVGAKLGGQLEVLIHKLHIYCLPKNLPERLVIDVSHLEVGKGVHISELQLPEGVRTKIEPSALVVNLEAPKVEVVAAAPAAAAAAPAKGAPAAKAAAAPAAKK